MKNIKKKLFLIILIVLSIFLVKNVKAESRDNVSGYAWSENIGWISFNCTDAPMGAGIPCQNSNYGVNIDEGTGDFSGYAWSENIGWISFQPEDVEKGQCVGGIRANFDSKTGEVTGFARVLSAADGWDGCLKLRGTVGGIPQPYGVSIDPLTGNFSGWAWSDNVLGWVSFTHFNCDSNGDGTTDQKNYPGCPKGQTISDYQVKASFNASPNAGMDCYIEECGGSGCACNGSWETYNQDSDLTNAIYKIINKSTDPDPGDSIAYSTWTLRNTASGEIVYQMNCLGACDYTIQNHPGGDYNVELQVADQRGKSSAITSHSLRIKEEAKAEFECSLVWSENPNDWQSCDKPDFLNKMPGTIIYFKDNLPDPHKHSSSSQEGVPIKKRTWSLNDEIISQDNSPTSSIVLLGGSNKVKLEIEDGQAEARTAARINSFQLLIPSPPIWKEVPSASLMEKVLSVFYRFFRV